MWTHITSGLQHNDEPLHLIVGAGMEQQVGTLARRLLGLASKRVDHRMVNNAYGPSVCVHALPNERAAVLTLAGRALQTAP